MKTKPFRMKSDIIFNAKDITDAMRKLSKHFNDIKKGIDSNLIIASGEIDVRLFGEYVPPRSLLSASRNIHLKFPVYVPPGSTLEIKTDLYNNTPDTFIATDIEVRGNTRIELGRLVAEKE